MLSHVQYFLRAVAFATALYMIFGASAIHKLLKVNIDNSTRSSSITKDGRNHMAHSVPLELKTFNLSECTEISGYVHPVYPSVVGKSFNLSEKGRNVAKKLISELLTSFSRRPVEMESERSLPRLKPVTGISSNHFTEFIHNFGSLQKVFPQTKTLVYDLGLNQEQVIKLQSTNSVEYRKFDFSLFPEHVRDLYTYAFKPLIIQQTLAHFGGVLWHDSSIILEQNYTERMVEQKSGFLYYTGGTGHSITAATHPRMFEYLPMKGKEQMSGPMEQAGGMIVYNTKNVLQNIMKWAIICSLHKECIAPSGSRVNGCNFSGGKYKYGGCHRYDQSMFSILSSNAFNYQNERYTLVGNEKPASVNRE